MQNKTLTVPFDLKEVKDDGRFTGYGSVFDNVDSYNEVVVKGAFKKTLSKHRKTGKLPKLLWQHNSDQVIGKYLSMKEDDHGLLVEGQLFVDDIQQAKEAHFLMKQGEIDGLSIGFITKSWTYDKEKNVRYLNEIDLWEVSVVTFPANTAARVVGAKAADSINDIRAFEAFLREEGFSANAAKAIASNGFSPSLHLRDEGEETGIDLRDAAVRAITGELQSIFKSIKGE